MVPYIHLKVVSWSQDGSEIYFKCKMTTPIQKLMHAVVERDTSTLETREPPHAQHTKYTW